MNNSVLSPWGKERVGQMERKALTYIYTRRRRWHPTPAPLPGKSQGRRSLVGRSPRGLQELDTTERLHFHFSLSCIGEGYGNPPQCSCLENPRDGGAWWAAVYRVAQSRTRLKRLSSSSSRVYTTCAVLSYGRLFATLLTVNPRLLLSIGFFGKNTGAGCHFLL